jgi:hypothetical protein
MPIALQKAKDALKGREPVIVYVHGMGNKKEETPLKDDWDRCLFGHGMQGRTRFAYWIDRETHPVPEDASSPNADRADVDFNDWSLPGMSVFSSAAVKTAAKTTVKTTGKTKAKPKDLIALLRQSTEQVAAAPAPRRNARFGSMRLEDTIIGKLGRGISDDVTNWDTNSTKSWRYRDIIKQELLDCGKRPLIVIAHSLGTAITYEVLAELGTQVEVVLFATLGSPLVYDGFRESVNAHLGRKESDLLSMPAGVAQWLSIIDEGDSLIGWGGELRDSLKSNVALHEVRRSGINRSFSAHPALGYLASRELKDLLFPVLGAGFRTQLSGAMLTQSVSRALPALRRVHAKDEEPRQTILLELAQINGSTSGSPRKFIHAELTKIGLRPKHIEDFNDYVAAHLTRSQILQLDASSSTLKKHLKRMWTAGHKRALLDESNKTVQAQSARAAYSADGKDIRWAVLDTGIDSRHPHFVGGTIEQSWDCTQGPIKAAIEAETDGHGTHVAGIIAGQTTHYSGIAPLTKLHCYKVLTSAGGTDVEILRAIDHIWKLNNEAGTLVIHGVNLSLGGPYDVESYNCGFTPICRALRKLWQQGVLVVIAAGNEGYADLLNAENEVVSANLDLSLSDPGNLEEALVVGSVHKSAPLTYGVSYFSSRGPTADGRAKPDLVAPGEKIMSCALSDKYTNKLTGEQLYVALSGTSMAAPHVSGVAAAFMSVKREYIGRPQLLRELMLRTATDLKRDRYFQGAGMPNLMKMLLEG